MAKLSEFMGKLLKKPDITSEEEQWRISAKMDNNVDYHCGFRDCFDVVKARWESLEAEFMKLADEAYAKFRNGAGTYYDGQSDAYYYAIGEFRNLLDEVKKYEQI